MTLYVVTEGEYSDYHIVGIYSTKEHAEKVKKYYNGLYDYPDIEEWELDKDIPENLEDVREYYRISYDEKQWRKGNWSSTRFTKIGKDIKDCQWRMNDVYPKYFIIDIPCDRVKDEAHAIKIAQDKMAEIKAMKDGIS